MTAYLKKCSSLGRVARGCMNLPAHQRSPHPQQLYRYTQTEASSHAEPASNSIHITDSCVKQLLRINEGNKHLRVSVEGGGCSGFQCKFELASDQNIVQEDRVFERNGVKVIVDDVSLEYIKGATVDYHEELIRSAFTVINIPMSENGCSCGISFSLKM